MMPTATCQYCGWNGPADQCGPLKNAWERLQPGDTVPAGECPKCNASAMLDEATPLDDTQGVPGCVEGVLDQRRGGGPAGVVEGGLVQG